MVLPLIVAGPEAMVKLTERLELAVAVRANGASPTCLPGKAANVIAWASRFTVSTATLLVTLP